MRGRIDELTRQLDNANAELWKLQTNIGQVTSYNEILVHENEELRKEIRTLKGGRQRSDEVPHSSESEDNDDDKSARVCLNFLLGSISFLIY